MSKRKVFVIENDYNIVKMFESHDDYELVNQLNKADILVFPGGADVDPERYGQKIHKLTAFNKQVDARDDAFYKKFEQDKLKIGICRGGQFLNVSNGGKMWQHVNNHGGTHEMIDLLGNKTLKVTSTHHQMMRAGEKGEVIGIAKMATIWEDDAFTHKSNDTEVRPLACPQFDTEVVWYPNTRSLCFQPHPEYGNESTKDYFFELIDKFY